MCFTAQGIFVHAPHFPGLSGANSRPIGRARRRLDLADATLRAYTYSLNAKLDALLRLTSAHAAGAKLKQAIAGRSIMATNNRHSRRQRGQRTHRWAMGLLSQAKVRIARPRVCEFGLQGLGKRPHMFFDDRIDG